MVCQGMGQESRLVVPPIPPALRVKRNRGHHIEIVPIPGIVKSVCQKRSQEFGQISPAVEFKRPDKFSKFPNVIAERACAGKRRRPENAFTAQAL